jgi:ABC-type transport system involved in cytochrome c biogenesis permease component
VSNCGKRAGGYTVPVLPPVVERELRIGLLRRKSREQWVRAAQIAGGITLFFLMFMAMGSSPSPGRTLFQFLFVLACFGVVTRGFGLTSDLFSEERRNGTLGLLVLTGLTPLEIFAYKLFGATLLTSYGLLGSMPFFAIPFLAGGVSAAHFLCALVFLTNALLFCVSIGLFASVIHREGGQAQTSALAIAAIVSSAAPLPWWMTVSVLGTKGIGHSWLVTSPVYGGYLAFTGFTGGSAHEFWTASGITLCYSLVALFLAAAILQRTWRDGPDGEAPAKLRDRWRAWIISASNARRRLRLRLLDQNPFAWVAARNRGPALLAQTFVASVALIYVGLFYTVGPSWLTVGNALMASAIVHLGLHWIIAYAAAKRFAEERQSGGFEVLLTTPLPVKEIVGGQIKGLIVQFKITWCFVTAFDVLLACSNFAQFNWSPANMVVYLLMWAMLILLWYSVHIETAARAMWISTWTGRPGYAAVQAMRTNLWSLVWLWFLWRGPFRRTLNIPSAEIVILVILLVFVTLAAFGNRGTLRDKLVRELRDIACAPIPARNDKRFKNWDAKKIFPPGRWGYFELHPTDSTGTQRLP